MKWIIPVFVVSVAIPVFSCNQADKKVAPVGVEHKLIKLGAGDPVHQGNYLKVHVVQKFNDSLLSDTRNAAPPIMKYDTASMTKESYAIFAGVSEGDSLVFSVPADSAFKNNIPPFAKKGGFLNTFVKVLHIYRSHEEVVAETGETGY